MEFQPVSQPLLDSLIAVAKAYAKHHDINLQTVSRKVHGDSPVLDKLIAGEGSISFRKYDQMMGWFSKHWPADLPVPPVAVAAFPKAKKRR